ncbi:MAG: type II toxin-antitoxin system VapC family toxin [candidate division Zixibacteria bacterium]|nr:type II toxin-antitoxin system VapC family toxin [candidate division Zixibacteria bacterium]
MVDWIDIFRIATNLSENHTGKTGSRSLDILHVASALFLKVDLFFTLDVRQSKLAKRSGMKIDMFNSL